MTRTPEDTARAVPAGVSRLVAGGLTREEREAQLDHLAGLYAESTDVRHPLAPPDSRWSTPLRTRAAIRAHFAGAHEAMPDAERFDPVGVVVHTTTDPELVVIELAYEGRVAGRDVRVPAVFVVRVRDGEIVESRDYAAHAAAPG